MVYLTGCLLVSGNLGPQSLVGISGRCERINGLKWNESTSLHANVRFYPSGSPAIYSDWLAAREENCHTFFLHTLYSVCDSKVDSLSGYNSVQ